LVYLTLVVAIANHQSLLALRWTPVAQAALTLVLGLAEHQDHSPDRTDATSNERKACSTGRAAVLDVAAATSSWILPRPWLRACRQTFFVWSLLNLPVSVALAIHLMGSALSATSPLDTILPSSITGHVHRSEHACGRPRWFLGATCTDPRVTLPCSLLELSRL
jgi:hypothetical protein